MARCTWLRWVALAMLGLPTLVAAQGLTGTVVKVVDGDTVDVDLGASAPDPRLSVRLYGIDAPEKQQPGGEASRRALASRVMGRKVFIEPQDQDRYGRLVGVLFLGPENLNDWMVAQGQAWVYRQYARDPATCRDEHAARQRRQGFWALDQDDWIAPWEWRQVRRRQARSATDYTAETAESCVASLGGRGGRKADAARGSPAPAPPGAASADCPVKGNISSRGRIYHTPDSRGYAGTVIDPSKGERCFASVEEAEAEGWRAPR